MHVRQVHCKVGQPNSSRGGAAEVLLCFLLTVEVITSLVMQMSIPLFRLGVMQRSCQRCRIKTPPSFTSFFFSFSPSSSLVPSSFRLFLKPVSRQLPERVRDTDVATCERCVTLSSPLSTYRSLYRSLMNRFQKLKSGMFAQANLGI